MKQKIAAVATLLLIFYAFFGLCEWNYDFSTWSIFGRYAFAVSVLGFSFNYFKK